MKVTSINQHIADRPGMKIVNAGAVEGFFLIYYAPEDSPEPPRTLPAELSKGLMPSPTLTVYYNQAGREVFAIEE